MKIHACGISVAIDGMKTLGIKGRVLKNIPIQSFQELQEATDIAVERALSCKNKWRLSRKCSRGISCPRCILEQRTMCGDQYLSSK